MAEHAHQPEQLLGAFGAAHQHAFHGDAGPVQDNTIIRRVFDAAKDPDRRRQETHVSVSSREPQHEANRNRRHIRRREEVGHPTRHLRSKFRSSLPRASTSNHPTTSFSSFFFSAAPYPKSCGTRRNISTRKIGVNRPSNAPRARSPISKRPCRAGPGGRSATALTCRTRRSFNKPGTLSPTSAAMRTVSSRRYRPALGSKSSSRRMASACVVCFGELQKRT